MALDAGAARSERVEITKKKKKKKKTLYRKKKRQLIKY